MKPNGIIRNVIFDLGGVLVDFVPERCMESLGFSEKAREAFRRSIFPSLWEYCDRVPYGEAEIRALFKAHVPGFEKEVDRLWDSLSDITRVMPYTDAWLSSLRERGLRLYVLSNYGRRAFEMSEPGYAFLSRMDGRLISYEIEKIKPEPEIFLELCRRYGLQPEESVFLDDRKANIEEARKLGFRGIVFESYEQASASLNEMLEEA